MRGSFRTIVIELPESRQVWKASDVGMPLTNALEALTGIPFSWYPTAGALLLLPKEKSKGHGPGGEVVEKLTAIVEGRYVIPEHASYPRHKP